MFPVLQIAGLAIQTPGLILLIGVLLGLNLAERFAPRRGVDPSSIYNLVSIALIAGVIGARLSFAGQHWGAFSGNLLSLFSLNTGLLDPLGGIAIGLITTAIFMQRTKMALWPTLDALTPLLAVFALALAVSHIASGSAFGSPTDLPWAIFLWGADRHPAQIFETLAAAGILLVLWPGRSAVHSLPTGKLFLYFVALTAAARVFLEFFRGDSVIIFGSFRLAQVAAWLILAICLWALSRKQFQPALQPSEPSSI